MFSLGKGMPLNCNSTQKHCPDGSLCDYMCRNSVILLYVLFFQGSAVWKLLHPVSASLNILVLSETTPGCL